MNNVLYCVGLTQEEDKDILSQGNEFGMDIKVVNNVMEFLRELDADPSNYSFAILCVKGFYILNGESVSNIMTKLQSIIGHNSNINFCFLDEDNFMQLDYNNYCAPLKNSCYASVQKITLRVLKTALKKILTGNNEEKTQDIQPSIKRDEIEPLIPTKKKYVFGLFKGKNKIPDTTAEEISDKVKKIKDNKSISVPKENNIESLLDLIQTDDNLPKESQEDRPIIENKPIIESEPITDDIIEESVIVEEEPLSVVDDTTTEPQAIIEEPIIKKVVTEIQDKKEFVEKVVKLSKNKVIGKHILVTQGYSSGASTTAILLAKDIANTGINTCYVEISNKLYSSNVVIDEEDVLGSETNNILSSIVNKHDYDNVGLYENLHVIRDSLIPTQEFSDKQLVEFIKSTNKLFDAVVYDIDIDILIKYPILLSLFTDKFFIVMNTMLNLVKTVMKLSEINELEDNYLYDLLVTNLNLVINRCSKTGINKSNVAEKIVNLNENLCEIELLSVFNGTTYNKEFMLAEDKLTDISKNILGGLWCE